MAVKKPKGVYTKSGIPSGVKKATKPVELSVSKGIRQAAVNAAVSVLKNISKTNKNPVDVVKGLSDAERKAVGKALRKINPAPKTGKFPSKAESPKGGTQIMAPKGTGKVIKIDPKGNISSRQMKIKPKNSK